MKRSASTSFRSFGKCTHGRNWGFVNEVCYTEATHERRGFPEHLACEWHAFEGKYASKDDPDWIQYDPDWIPIEKDFVT